MENLDKITQTIEGYPVKDLRWIALDNIIVGLVKCPFWGTDKRPYVSCKWRRNGYNVKDKNRPDLTLKMS